MECLMVTWKIKLGELQSLKKQELGNKLDIYVLDRNEKRNNKKKEEGRKEGQGSQKSGRSCPSWRDLKAWPGGFEGPSVLLCLLMNVVELLLYTLHDCSLYPNQSLPC